MSGYAAYEAGVLRRAVFVNLDAWLNSMEAAGAVRPAVHVDLGFAFALGNGTAGAASQGANVDAFRRAKVQVRRLVVNHADDLGNLTWAGQSFEDTADVSPSGQQVVETVAIAEGVDVRASEAVLLTFEV